MTKERIEKVYQVGAQAVDPGFVSTSVFPGTAMKFASSPGDGASDDEIRKSESKIAVFIILAGKSGRAISPFAFQHDQENEILFANSTSMTVSAVSPEFQEPGIGDIRVILLTEK